MRVSELKDFFQVAKAAGNQVCVCNSIRSSFYKFKLAKNDDKRLIVKFLSFRKKTFEKKENSPALICYTMSHES